MCADSSAEHSNSDNGWKACPVLMMAKLPGTVELLLGRNIQPYGRQKPIGNDFGVNDLPFFFFFSPLEKLEFNLLYKSCIGRILILSIVKYRFQLLMCSFYLVKFALQ